MGGRRQKGNRQGTRLGRSHSPILRNLPRRSHEELSGRQHRGAARTRRIHLAPCGGRVPPGGPAPPPKTKGRQGTPSSIRSSSLKGRLVAYRSGGRTRTDGALVHWLRLRQ